MSNPPASHSPPPAVETSTLSGFLKFASPPDGRNIDPDAPPCRRDQGRHPKRTLSLPGSPALRRGPSPKLRCSSLNHIAFRLSKYNRFGQDRLRGRIFGQTARLPDAYMRSSGDRPSNPAERVRKPKASSPFGVCGHEIGWHDTNFTENRYIFSTNFKWEFTPSVRKWYETNRGREMRFQGRPPAHERP
jgi:hypothetical protein